MLIKIFDDTFCWLINLHNLLFCLLLANFEEEALKQSKPNNDAEHREVYFWSGISISLLLILFFILVIRVVLRLVSLLLLLIRKPINLSFELASCVETTCDVLCEELSFTDSGVVEAMATAFHRILGVRLVHGILRLLAIKARVDHYEAHFLGSLSLDLSFGHTSEL